MGRGLRIEVPGMLHHVVNRAIDRRTIFSKPADYAAFLALMIAAVGRFPIELIAYCVMPNHWHLALRPLETGALSAYMHWLTARHSCHFRFVNGGCGHVYQGRFRSSVIDGESYYWNAIRYVEGNALRARLVSRAEEWEWGSLFERERHTIGLLAPPPIPLPDTWVEMVNGGIDAVELEQFRESLNRCVPLRLKVGSAV